MENTSNKPRDFFIHVSAFIVLYFVAIALITIFFTLIDYRFPDVLGGYYGDPYSGPIRFAIASLIILTPIFLVLMRTIQKDARALPARAKLGVRKWLTYITLFLAGATVIGDLIVLLNSYLGGALPFAFGLKALSLLAVAGVGFAYFYLDLKDYWQMHAKESRFSALGFIAIVLGSIIISFAVLGSPAMQRELRLDAQRQADLINIQGFVVNYWQQNQKLPADTSVLENPLSGFTVPLDPETQSPYSYKPTGDVSFEICATFSQETSSMLGGEFYPVLPGVKDSNNWKHTSGKQCFERTIDKNLIKPSLPQIQVPIPGKTPAAIPVN